MVPLYLHVGYYKILTSICGISIRSFHPSLRSSEWVEALHEMGWEHLHPTYTSQSQHTSGALDACSNPFNEWIAMDEPRGNEYQTQVVKDRQGAL